MRRKYLKPDIHKPADKKKTTFFEVLIVRYFDRQSEKNDISQKSTGFNQDEIYNKILRSIKAKENGLEIRKIILKVAASIALICTLSTILYINRNDVNRLLSPVKMAQKEAEKGQVVTVNLEDGTKIWLKAGSKLTYPTHFDSDTRQVTLTGEAYFEVAHLEKKPFIIISGQVKTVVLGTSFNINAYPENRKVEVTVLSGKVAVITPGKKTSNQNTVYLTPNQKATYDSEKVRTDLYRVNAEESIEWKVDKMIFKSTPLMQVVKEIERKYNITLGCSDKIKKCRITADFHNYSLNKTLKVVTKMIDGTLSLKDGHYYLDGRACE